MPQAYEPVFTPRELVQATLPHSNPGDDMPTWSRRNGNYVLGIYPGWNYDKDQTFGYPIPRLLIYWIATEVLRKKQRRLELGDTLNGFMDKVGLNPQTGGREAQRCQATARTDGSAVSCPHHLPIQRGNAAGALP